jgi:redox-sensitive bicupin YhaK (pirin superfamily)
VKMVSLPLKSADSKSAAGERPVIDIQRNTERGATRTGWLDSRHSFSFNRYWNPSRTGIGSLVALNEDRVGPAAGFGAHPHRDMEILTWVTSGVLRHRDSLGSESLLPAGTVQAMRAGKGIVHSEWNASNENELRFFQIWLRPRTFGADPSYGELRLGEVIDGNDESIFRTIASSDGRDGSLAVDQDAIVSIVHASAGRAFSLDLDGGRLYWLQVLDGSFEVGGQRLKAGDGAGIRDPQRIISPHSVDGRALLFDMAIAP